MSSAEQARVAMGWYSIALDGAFVIARTYLRVTRVGRLGTY